MGFSAILVTIDCALVIIVRYRERLVGFTRIQPVGPHHPMSRLVDGPHLYNNGCPFRTRETYFYLQYLFLVFFYKLP